MNETNVSKMLIIPVQPMVYNIIGSVMTFLFVLALFVDISVFVAYKRNSKLHDNTNIWIISLILCDLLIVLNSFPLVIITSFSKEFILGDAGCKWSGFVVTVLGISSIYILTGISAYRYILMFNLTSAKSITRTNILLCVVLCFMFGLFWGVAPLIGWGSYSLEGIGISCAPNWRSVATRDRSYMLAIYVCALIVPVTVIGYCYCRILLKIWCRKQTRSVWLKHRQVKRDTRVTISVAFIILSFFASWLPYAVVSMLEGFMQIDIRGVSPMLVQLPCLMAKTACIWNPIIYVSHNSRFRNAYIETYGFLKRFSIFKVTSSGDKNDSSNSINSKNTIQLAVPSSPICTAV